MKKKDRARQWAARAGAVLSLLTLCACGGGGSAGPDLPRPPADSLEAALYPMNVGDTRAWRAADDKDGQRLRVERIDSTVALAGGPAFLARSSDTQGASVDEEYLQVRSTGVYAVAGPGSDPLAAALGSAQVFRAGLSLGETAVMVDQTVSLDVDRDGQADSVQMHVTSTFVARESLTTSLGSFSGTAHVRTVARSVTRLAASNASTTVVFTEDRWYAPGIGPIRARSVTEQNGANSTNRDEEVVAYGVGTLHQPNVAPRLLHGSPSTDEHPHPQGPIILGFDHGVDPLSLWGEGGLLLLDAAGKPVPLSHGTLNAALTEIRFEPTTPLADGTYTVRHGGKATDISGLPLPDPLLTFTVDAHGPRLLSSEPANGAVEVPLTGTLRLTFDDDLFIESGRTPLINVIMANGGQTQVAAKIQGKELIATLPEPLQRGRKYILRLNGGIKDRHGVFASEEVGTFTTVGVRDTAQFIIDERWVHVVKRVDEPGPGHGDIVLLGQDPGSGQMSLLIRRQQPDGRLAAPVRRYDFGRQDYGLYRVINPGDVNGDGRMDLLLVDDFNAVLLLQQPDGGFVQERVDIADLADFKWIVASGIDSEGKAWVALADKELIMWQRQGPGAWARVSTTPVGGAPKQRVLGATMGDINGDGQADWVWVRLAADGSGRTELVWALRQGLGFGEPQFVSMSGPLQGARILIKDWNGDGRADLIITPADVIMGSEMLMQSWLQTPSGRFEYAGTPSSEPNYEGAALGDVNHDGRADLVLCKGTRADVFLRSPQGGWQDARSYAMYGGTCGALQVLDWNSDGVPDLIAANVIMYGQGDGTFAGLPPATAPGTTGRQRPAAVRWGLPLSASPASSALR